MIQTNREYEIFFQLIEKFGPTGFTGIDPSNPLMLEAEVIMKQNDQFFYFCDLILFHILFTSSRSMEMLGVKPAQLSPLSFYQALHPNDLKRDILVKNILLKSAHKLFLAEEGVELLSTCFQVHNAKGNYFNVLSQFYIYYSEIPYKSVFVFILHTNVDWLQKNKFGHHWYLGDDISNFRFPNDELLSKGHIYSKREFDILQLLEKGISTEHIATKLF